MHLADVAQALQGGDGRDRHRGGLLEGWPAPAGSLPKCLTRTGTLVLASGDGGPVIGPLGRYVRALALSPFVPQRLRVHAAKPSQSDLVALTALIEAGSVTPVIEATYALADTAEAMRHSTPWPCTARCAGRVRRPRCSGPS